MLNQIKTNIWKFENIQMALDKDRNLTESLNISWQFDYAQAPFGGGFLIKGFERFTFASLWILP